MRTVIFLVLLVAVIVANKFLRFDVDERPKDSPQRALWAKAAYPKSYLHALQAFTLVLAAVFLAAMPIIVAAPIVFFALAIFEWSQSKDGFIDWIDIGANGAGVVAAVLVFYLAGSL